MSWEPSDSCRWWSWRIAEGDTSEGKSRVAMEGFRSTEEVFLLGLEVHRKPTRQFKEGHGKPPLGKLRGLLLRPLLSQLAALKCSKVQK